MTLSDGERLWEVSLWEESRGNLRYDGPNQGYGWAGDERGDGGFLEFHGGTDLDQEG